MIPEHWLRYISNQVNAAIRMHSGSPDPILSQTYLNNMAVAAYKSILAVEAEAFKDLREKYLEGFQRCVENEDAQGLGELIDEMTQWEYERVFNMLNNYHRGQVRNLISEYHKGKNK